MPSVKLCLTQQVDFFTFILSPAPAKWGLESNLSTQSAPRYRARTESGADVHGPAVPLLQLVQFLEFGPQS